MSILKILLILLISVSLPLKALGDDKAIVLNVGQASPYTGVLVPTEALQSLRKDLLDAQADNSSFTKSVTLYKQNEDLLNTKVATLQTQNNKLAEQLYSSQSLTTWERVAFFGLGVLVTGAISYGTYRAAISSR